MLIICCYLEKDSGKNLKVQMSNSSYFEITTFLFQTLPSNKRHTVKFQN